MFEKAIIPAAAQSEPNSALRALDWGELVGRLAAGRDVRALLARPLAAGGSFAAQAACIRGVNQQSLSGGKAPASTTFASAGSAFLGGRDK